METIERKIKVAYLSEKRIFVTPQFVEENKLQLISQDKIIERYNEVKNEFMSFEGEVLIDFLSFESAKEFLKNDYVAEVVAGTKEYAFVSDINEAAQDFLDYMNFAWGKAQDERGISASRSVQKLGAWLFVMGRDDLRLIIDNDDLYNPYGAPALIAVCKEMKIKIPKSLVEFAKHKC